MENGEQDMMQEHFGLFDAMGFLQVEETDEGVVVLLLGKCFNWSGARTLLPSLYKYIEQKLAAIEGQFDLLYVNTDFSYSQNSPGVLWLWRAYRSLPQHCRDALRRCYVLHCDWAVRAAAALLCPWLAGDFYAKVVYVPRAEFLPRSMLAALDLPKFVDEHEQCLSKHPLIDYGIATCAQETPVPQIAGLRDG